MALPKIQTVFFDLGDTLVTSPPNRLWLPGAQSLLTSLKGRQLHLGIISNTGNNDRPQLLAQLLPPGFDFAAFEDNLILLSREVQMEKPKPGIFLKAIERAARPALECLYISENLLETLVAQQVGMRAARLRKSPDPDLPLLFTELMQSGLV